MEKMNKAYVGTVDRWSTMHWTDDSGEYTHVTFKNGTLRDNPWPFEPHEECYLVKKADLDAYEASIEQLKHTQVWGENQRLKARIHQLEVANVGLRDINKALGEENSKLTEENEALVERNTKLKVMLDKFYGMTSVGEKLRAANEKLKAEIADLNERINHLEIIQRLLAKENGELRGTNNELNAVIAQLRQKLDKYEGVQEVIDIRTTNDQDCFVLWWTGRDGDKHKLELKLVQNPIDETTRIGTTIYE